MYTIPIVDEFVAHGSNVNAVAITPYKGRMLATGGEDRKIAIWAIGKPQPILVCAIMYCID